MEFWSHDCGHGIGHLGVRVFVLRVQFFAGLFHLLLQLSSPTGGVPALDVVSQGKGSKRMAGDFEPHESASDTADQDATADNHSRNDLQLNEGR